MLCDSSIVNREKEIIYINYMHKTPNKIFYQWGSSNIVIHPFECFLMQPIISKLNKIHYATSCIFKLEIH